MDELHSFIDTCPIIDNHAHNILVDLEADETALLKATSDASDECLAHAVSSLAHLRAKKALKQLYESDSDDWAALVAARRVLLERMGPEELVSRCLQGTECILIDDGIPGRPVQPYAWHDRFTKSKNWRIERVEYMAETIAEKLLTSPGTEDADQLWMQFSQEFEKQMHASVGDPEVVGLKSVIAYYTGLVVDEHALEAADLPRALAEYAASAKELEDWDMISKPLNDWILMKTITILSEARAKLGYSKPLQLHTGLGDSQLNLLRADPAHLQPLIDAYPDVDFVLLHCSYPFTRNASYLATFYKNAWLDVGLVFHVLSRDGQEAALRQAMEFAPTQKLLWSTDGNFLPETYWISNRHARIALKKVLSEYVDKGDLTIKEAIDIARGMLRENSRKLYRLGSI